jgi:mannose-6-phosphate isomerase-like protein (cupin superfamily)
MRVDSHETEAQRDGKDRPFGLLISEKHGGVKGFCMGISYYDREEYGKPGIHEDQEGFYVLEGAGMARVGDSEFPIRPGSAFLAAKGVPHTMKCDAGKPIKVLWTHGAA